VANILPKFLSDGKRVLYSANEPGHRIRVWVQDLDGSAPKPISPEGVGARSLSFDNQWALVGMRDASSDNVRLALLSINDGKTVEISGLKPTEMALGWTSDGQLYVASADTTGAGVKVEKLDPHTGARTPWRTLATAPIGGVVPDPPIITPDGNTYGFDYRVRLSDLYTVSGVR